jgi:sec-independent protein translocase protein TatA
MLAGGLGTMEIMIILVIVLIIFGAGKLPQVGESLGKGIRSLRKEVTGMQDKSDNSLGEKDSI